MFCFFLMERKLNVIASRRRSNPPKNKYPPLVGGSKSQISRRGKTYAKNKSNLTPHPTLRVSLSLLDYSGPPRRWRGQERSKVRPAPYGFRFAPPYRKSATRGEGNISFTLHSSLFTQLTQKRRFQLRKRRRLSFSY